MGRVIGGIEEERAIDRRVEEGTNGPRNAVWLHFDILESTRLDSLSFRILHIDRDVDGLCLRCQKALNCEADTLERLSLYVSHTEGVLVLLLLGYLSRAGVEGVGCGIAGRGIEDNLAGSHIGRGFVRALEIEGGGSALATLHAEALGEVRNYIDLLGAGVGSGQFFRRDGSFGKRADFSRPIIVSTGLVGYGHKGIITGDNQETERAERRICLNTLFTVHDFIILIKDREGNTVDRGLRDILVGGTGRVILRTYDEVRE